MGFYAPAEIVRDAREHGVEVRAPDINFSEWDNTLEGRALRLGFRQIDGLGEVASQTLVQARGKGYRSIEDLALRAGLPKRAFVILAEADAFRSIGLDRREALWKVRRLSGEASLPLFARVPEQPPETAQPLPLMPLGEHVLADYQTLRLSLKGYPMQFLRELFRRERVMSCAEIGEARDGQKARCAGVVLVRQMPGTAGVVFITLSDETGIANVVVWPRVLERYRGAVMGARLLLVEGRVQRSPEGIIHLVSDRLIDRTSELDRLSEDEFRPLIHEGDIPPPSDPRGRERHPRQVRILPKSRDFH
jgi:error-prone DNA polymerase